MLTLDEVGQVPHALQNGKPEINPNFGALEALGSEVSTNGPDDQNEEKQVVHHVDDADENIDDREALDGMLSE